jgi:hypothetical protein
MLAASHEKRERCKTKKRTGHLNMTVMPILATVPMFAAAGYALVYLLAGGGLGGAILIFIVAKLLGK